MGDVFWGDILYTGHMTTNPFYNALFAIAYIIVLVTVMFVGPSFLSSGPDQSIFYPILALALLVLSVALMAYLFFYQPLMLIIDGKRDEAVRLFLQTVGIFAAAIVALLLIFFVVRG